MYVYLGFEPNHVPSISLVKMPFENNIFGGAKYNLVLLSELDEREYS